MSTLKKVLSLVLALTMVFSTVAVAFAADTTESYYAGEESVGIDTLADFEALGYDKTQQKFYMYLGVDYYEQNAAGAWELTDHYVQPGAQLRAEVYFKTNMYTGSGMAIYFNFDRNFFDVTNGKGATYPATANSYDPDKVKYPTENYPYNIAHDANDGAAINGNNPIVSAEEINFKYTTKWARNVPGFKEATNANFHGIPLAESDEWDLWYVNVGTGTVNSYAFEFETDEYFFTFDVKVREFMPDGETKLADGTTGNVTLDKRCWTIYDNAAHAGTSTASRRVGNIGTYYELIKESSIKRMNLQNWYTIDDFYTDDCNHTFTIGEPSDVDPNAKKYTVTFLENDGTEISAEEYVENTDVTVPAAVENELGWVNMATGKVDEAIVSGGTITAIANITYKRILTTDKFDIKVNLDGGTIDGESTLTIKAGYGEEVDLTEYTPVKPGYTAVWEPSTVKVESINGATAKVKWEAKTFQATFYANKGDAEAYKVVDIKYGARLECAAPTAADESVYFDGWYNAATDEAASANAGTSLGNYNLEDNSAYYAKWTEYPHKVIIKAKNFTTGEWTDIETLYGKSGSVSVNKLKEIKASVNVAEDLAWDGKVTFARGDNYTSMSFNETYASADIITEAVAYEGTKVLYLHAFPIFELEYQLPVYDEATGKYTDEYTTAVKEFKATSFVESAQINLNKRDVVPAAGYVFDKWTTADGATPTFFDSGSNYVFTLSRANGSKLTIKASFKLEEYEIRFLIGTSDGQSIIPVGVNTIGAVLNAETAEFVYATGANKGQARKLPEVGKVNEEMAEPVQGKEGHKLIGWYLTNPDELIDINNFEITPELAAKAIVPTSGNKYILVNSKWEAQNYDAKFYFWAEGSTIDNPIYTEEPIVVSAPVGTGRDDLVKMFSDADIAKLNASVPEGVTLSTTWRNEDGSTASNSLAVGGSKYYAIYETVQLRVYVDWNSKEDDSDWFDVSDQNVRYGDDTMRGEYNSVDRGVYHYVTAGLQVTNLEKPTPAHEIVGWKTYHVKDYTTVKDPSTWLEGTNDEGTAIAMDTIVYQAQWKEHKQFLFRIYDMNGNLSKALGKDFKMYYWKDSRVADKDRASIKTDDTMLILLLIPKFENGSLRLDPFYLAKDLFKLKNIGGLFKAIFTAIGTLIKGT